MTKINTEVIIGSLKLKNPVIAASGTFGFGREYSEYCDLNQLGGISVKGLTLNPRKGNPEPRIAETYAGIINSVGLQNPGVAKFLKNEIPFLRNFDTAIIANISGSSVEEYGIMAETLNSFVDAIEINVSCPNVKEGCIAFGKSAASVRAVTEEVKSKFDKTVIVKLTPNVTSIVEIAIAAQDGGADAVSLINTLEGMAIDIETRKPILANVYGGYSGPGVKPVALKMVYDTAHALSIPVIGMGGIENGNDAVEFLLAGAKAVMVGSANFVNPTACIDVANGIVSYMERKKFPDMKSFNI